MATSIAMIDRTAETDASIRPFSLDIPDDDLAYLRGRLASTRLPSKELVPDQSRPLKGHATLLHWPDQLAEGWRPRVNPRPSAACSGDIARGPD